MAEPVFQETGNPFTGGSYGAVFTEACPQQTLPFLSSA